MNIIRDAESVARLTISPIQSGHEPELGGYDVEWFVLDSHQLELLELTCSICTKVLRQAVFSTMECQHEFCQSCLQKWLEHDQSCPTCRRQLAEYDDIPSRRTRNKVRELQTRCRVSKDCPATKKLGQNVQGWWVEHETSCPFLPVPCLHCGSLIKRQDLSKHWSSACPHRPQECVHCQELIPLHQVESHQLECPARMIDCPSGCTNETSGSPFQLPQRDVSNHLQKDCPLHITLCDYAAYGCTFRNQRMKVREHLQQAMPLHLDLMQQSFHSLQETMKEMSNCYQKLLERLEQVENREQVAQDRAANLTSVRCRCLTGCDTHRCACLAAGIQCGSRCRCNRCKNPNPSLRMVQLQHELYEFKSMLLYKRQRDCTSPEDWQNYCNRILEQDMWVIAVRDYVPSDGDRASISAGDFGKIIEVAESTAVIHWKGKETYRHRFSDCFFEIAQIKMFERKSFKRRRSSVEHSTSIRRAIIMPSSPEPSPPESHLTP